VTGRGGPRTGRAGSAKSYAATNQPLYARIQHNTPRSIVVTPRYSTAVTCTHGVVAVLGCLLAYSLACVAQAAQGKRGSSKASVTSSREDESWEYSGGYWEARQAGEGFPQAPTPFA
jgi:hypothetical protein